MGCSTSRPHHDLRQRALAERRDRRRDDPGPGHLSRRTSSNPTNFVVVGSTLFFTATDASHPTRLWMGTFTGGPSLPDVSVGSTLPNSTYGQSVSFTVTVSGGGPTPTGTVQFLVDGTDFGSAVTLAGGSATSPSTTLLGAGNHTIQADYSGDSNYSASTGTYTQVVNQAPLSIIPDNQSRAVGQANPALTYTLSRASSTAKRHHGGHHRLGKPGHHRHNKQPRR